MSVFGACIVGYSITAPFRLQIVKYLDQHVQCVHIEAQLLGLSYLEHGLVFSSIPFTCLHFLCSYVPVGDDECPLSSRKEPTIIGLIIDWDEYDKMKGIGADG